MAWHYTSTKSGAQLRPSDTVFVYAKQLRHDYAELYGPEGRLLRGVGTAEQPCFVLSRDEFRQLLADSGSSVTLIETVVDRYNDAIAPSWAVDLDGSTQYLTRAGSLMSALGTSYSVQAWAWMDSVASSRAIVTHRSTTLPNPTGLFLGYSSSMGKFRAVVTDDAAVSVGLSSTTTPTTGRWYHLVMVRAGDDLTSYVDGAEEATGTASSPFGTITPSHLDFGSNFGGSATRSQFLDGRLDRIGVWGNRALTAPDVAELFNAGSGLAYAAMSSGQRSGLVAFHELDEASGDQIDATGNGYAMTPVGSPGRAEGVA